MSSYQCSPLSTADGIIGVFKQSSRFQEQKNLDEYTSVVVLDEVGLAEDSPRMPLKALHPLLEDGTDGSEDLTLTGTDLKSILILGAGPIVIGQACEFDYSGAQACKALREEGYRVILVNSNPATIMTAVSYTHLTLPTIYSV